MNVKEIYFIISISDKGLSSFFISFILLFFFLFSLSFYSFLLTFFVLILSYLSGTCILFCRHIWAELFFLFWMFLSGTFFRWGRGAPVTSAIPPPPAYAPVLCALFTCRNVESSNMSVNCEWWGKKREEIARCGTLNTSKKKQTLEQYGG